MRALSFLLAPLALLAGLCVGQAAEPMTALGNGSRVTSLENRLSKGLKARQPQEFQFLKSVVASVHGGRLPQKLVDSTFLWAVNRTQKYPFPVFERAHRLQASRLGVTF